VPYIEGDVLNKEVDGMGRVYQVVIRVRMEGLLAIVKARDGGEYWVRFVGAGTLAALTAKVRDVIINPDDKWAIDKYPPS